jgi:hypothetical protein
MRKIVSIAAASLFPITAFASNTINVSNLLKTKNGLSVFISNLAVWFEGVIFALSTLFILYAALLFITAAGNEEKIAKAKSIIVYGMIGIAVALLAFSVQSFVVSVLQ